MSEKHTVPVRILGQEYRVRSDAEDDDVVRRAARVVDETMHRIRTRTRTVDTLDVAVLAALNLANQLVARREDAGGVERGVDSRRMQALVTLVEDALEGDEDVP